MPIYINIYNQLNGIDLIKQLPGPEISQSLLGFSRLIAHRSYENITDHHRVEQCLSEGPANLASGLANPNKQTQSHSHR